MNNLILNSQILASGTSSNTDAVIDNIVNSSIMPGLILLGIVITLVLLDIIMRPKSLSSEYNHYYGHSKNAKTLSTKPVIAYKKAKITFDSVDKKSNIINIHFHGVSGNVKYELKEDHCQGSKGFHMYKDINDAFKHDQYGNVILEVLGYGTVNEYMKGYITTGQKVLQIIIDSTVFNRDSNVKTFMEHNDLTLNDLYTLQWRNRDGTEIIFTPKTPIIRSQGFSKYTIPQYTLTTTSNNRNIVEREKEKDQT